MKLLFIGIGNMGGAILKSVLASSDSRGNYEIFVADKSEQAIESMKEFGLFSVYKKEYLKLIDIIFLGVKPFHIGEAIEEHLDYVSDSQIIVSMAAGITLARLNALIGESKKIVRIMPNMPIAVGEGMTSLTPNKNVSASELGTVQSILEKNARCRVIDEEKIHSFIGMAGSSPAFLFLFLEAMADAGEKFGISREEALFFSSQSFLGSAKLFQETGTNPAVLRESICSPGGTTIEGIKSLQNDNFKEIVVRAVSKTIEKSIKMSESED